MISRRAQILPARCTVDLACSVICCGGVMPPGRRSGRRSGCRLRRLAGPTPGAPLAYTTIVILDHITSHKKLCNFYGRWGRETCIKSMLTLLAKGSTLILCNFLALSVQKSYRAFYEDVTHFFSSKSTKKWKKFIYIGHFNSNICYI